MASKILPTIKAKGPNIPFKAPFTNLNTPGNLLNPSCISLINLSADVDTALNNPLAPVLPIVFSSSIKPLNDLVTPSLNVFKESSNPPKLLTNFPNGNFSISPFTLSKGPVMRSAAADACWFIILNLSAVFTFASAVSNCSLAATCEFFLVFTKFAKSVFSFSVSFFLACNSLICSVMAFRSSNLNSFNLLASSACFLASSVKSLNPLVPISL